MSTPTAVGKITFFVANTLPIVAPMPKWTSGMAATWWKTKGQLPSAVSCCSAELSMSVVQILTGTCPVTSAGISLNTGIGYHFVLCYGGQSVFHRGQILLTPAIAVGVLFLCVLD
jgi:hypothetical protein